MEKKEQKYPYSYWKDNQNEKNITVYDNDIATASSIDEAVFLRRIIYLWEKYKNQKEMFIVPKRFAIPIGMSLYSFRNLVKKWEDLKLIKTKNKGLPLKKWYIIQEKRLAKYLTKLKENGAHLQVVESDKISYRKQQDQVVESDKIYNSIIYKRKTNTVSPQKVGLTMGIKTKKTFTDKYTKKLIEGLQIKRKVMRKINVSKWSKELQRLKLEIGKERFKTVLLWYIDHLSDKYVPKAYSADAFVSKFYNIEDAMNRVKPEFEPVKMSKEGTELAKEILEEFSWSATTYDQMPQAVQISLNNLKAFIKKNNEYLKKIRTKDINNIHKHFYFAEHVQYMLEIPLEYIRGWFHEVNDKVKGWKKWNGDLTPYIFNEKSPMFIKRGCEMSVEFTDNPAQWGKYVADMNSQISPK